MAQANGFDLAVVGAGSAGFSAAIAAAERGAKVLLVGHGTIGGTCVNVGCIPSKFLVRAAEAVWAGRAARRFAGLVGEVRLQDWTALRRQKDELVARLRREKYVDLLGHYGNVRYLEGRARLVAGGLEVAGRRLMVPRILLTTGARPRVPEIPGLERTPWLDSTRALALERLPRSLLVLGAGYVGAELAQAFSRLGVEVTLLCRRRLLPEAEPELSGALADHLRGEGLRLREGLRYLHIAPTSSGVRLEAEGAGGPEALEAEAVLIAAGRVPNSDGLGLEELGVARNAEGAVVVDRFMRTSREGIYAAGDVTDRHRYVYMAAHGGRIAAINALEGEVENYDDRAVPSVVFTDPELASVGMTEASARAAGLAVRTSFLEADQLPRALAANDLRVRIKLVAEAASGRLLGVHILAPHAGDSIQSGALALRAGMTADELGRVIFPYLTTVEGLKLAAQGFARDVSKLSCCAG